MVFDNNTVAIIEGLNLSKAQIEAIKAIYSAILSKERIIPIVLSPGSGRSNIIQALTMIIGENNESILLLVDRKEVLSQYKESFKRAKIRFGTTLKNVNNDSIVFATQQMFSRNVLKDQLEKFNYIILDNVDDNILHKYLDFFISQNITIVTFSLWFSRDSTYDPSIEKPIYSNIIKRPEFTESDAISYLLRLFKYNNIDEYNEPIAQSTGKSPYKPDIVLKKENIIILVEVKLYRSSTVSNNLIKIAAERLIKYNAIINTGADESLRGKLIKMCLIAFCHVDALTKEYFFDKYDINILDLGNLQYFSQGNTELMMTLMQMLPYSLEDIPSVEPNDFISDVLTTMSIAPDKPEEDKTDAFISDLRQCPFGRAKKAAQQYEKVGIYILNYLFAPEFSQESPQHSTMDNLFRMDYLCALKGTTAFWRLLIQHYNSKFVVFEFKNYLKQISQNNIYITEKYLNDAALRNVGLIVSRNGFDEGAKKAALGCLKEHKKLFIDISDNDLITMLEKKRRGEDPSDHLLEKLEMYLMSIGK